MDSEKEKKIRKVSKKKKRENYENLEFAKKKKFLDVIMIDFVYTRLHYYLRFWRRLTFFLSFFVFFLYGGKQLK